MLPKINRIKKKKDFEKIFKKKEKSFRNKLFVLKISENKLPYTRFGFVVSKKISSKATIRNKIRRRISSVVRSQKEKLKSGLDLIIIVLPGAEKGNFSETKEATIEILQKAKCLNL